MLQQPHNLQLPERSLSKNRVLKCLLNFLDSNLLPSFVIVSTAHYAICTTSHDIQQLVALV
jgi:hypothetical protein